MNEPNSVNKLRPPPPLIRMNKSPPPLCPIPTKTMKQPSINFDSDHRPFNTLWSLNPITISQQPSTIPTISTTHNSANPVISSSSSPSSAISCNRKRKAGGGNRELISMVKQQLQQLNKTLAALETVNEDDDLSDDDEQRSHQAHLANGTFPHQQTQFAPGNKTVGIDTDGFNQHGTPIRRMQPAWSDPISMEYPTNSYLLPAGHLTPPSDSVDTITGR